MQEPEKANGEKNLQSLRKSRIKKSSPERQDDQDGILGIPGIWYTRIAILRAQAAGNGGNSGSGEYLAVLERWLHCIHRIHSPRRKKIKQEKVDPGALNMTCYMPGQPQAILIDVFNRTPEGCSHRANRSQTGGTAATGLNLRSDRFGSRGLYVLRTQYYLLQGP